MCCRCIWVLVEEFVACGCGVQFWLLFAGAREVYGRLGMVLVAWQGSGSAWQGRIRLVVAVGAVIAGAWH